VSVGLIGDQLTASIKYYADGFPASTVDELFAGWEKMFLDACAA
jgi:hypothetical protein